MRQFRLAWKNARGNTFRSLAIVFCAALVASLVLAATFVVRGAEASLRSNLQRLGADLLILPWGTMTEKIGGVRLMSAAIDGWMPRAYLDKIAAIPGVERVSPQLHLATLHDSPYASVPQEFLVAYDPATDFVLHPWLGEGGTRILGPGEAIVGAEVVLPPLANGGREGEFELFGYRLWAADRLAPTGTTIDRTIFVNFETAAEMAATSGGAIRIMPGSISAIMVRAEMDAKPHDLAVTILETVSGVVPLENPALFQTERQQMIGVLRTLLGILGVIWALTVVFMGLAFAVAVHERRCEIGVLRALGFSQTWVFKTLILEGIALALPGGLVGVVVTIVGFSLWGDWAMRVARLPLRIPSPVGLVSLSLAGQAVALASVALAAFIPAWRISREEAALVMRE
ncbi:MAG: FtsX-like permease family protein [Chloroflexi bacterium]|nr:FtsX-like permease family protein [Chloroflexota bacterium]